MKLLEHMKRLFAKSADSQMLRVVRHLHEHRPESPFETDEEFDAWLTEQSRALELPHDEVAFIWQAMGSYRLKTGPFADAQISYGREFQEVFRAVEELDRSE